MTIKELKEQYYDPNLICKLEKAALYKFIRTYCNSPRVQFGLCDCLRKNGIRSIDQLKSTKIEDIESYDLLNETRMPYLVAIKNFLDTLEDN